MSAMTLDHAMALADTVTPAPADAHAALLILRAEIHRLTGHPATTEGVPMDAIATPVAPLAPIAPAVRFVKVGANGKLMPHDTNKGWLAVLEPARALMWCAIDATDSDVNYAGAEAAIVTLNAERYAGFDDWRLPTVDELAGLVDRSRCEPAIDTTHFPSAAHDFYWTSSPCAWSPSYAWCVGFVSGSVYDNHRVSVNRVRAVRGPVRQ